jgi:hypothetical protein
MHPRFEPFHHQVGPSSTVVGLNHLRRELIVSERQLGIDAHLPGILLPALDIVFEIHLLLILELEIWKGKGDKAIDVSGAYWTSPGKRRDSP